MACNPATGTPPTARIRIRVAPGGGADELVGRYGDAWKVRVGAAPERGRANVAVLSLLADSLELPRQSVRVVAGATSRDKVIEAAGITNEEAERRLEARRRKGGE